VAAGFETPTLDRMIAEPQTFELRDVTELIDEIEVILQLASCRAAAVPFCRRDRFLMDGERNVGTTADGTTARLFPPNHLEFVPNGS